MTLRVLLSADAAAFQTLRLQGLLECPTAFASSHEEEVDRPIAAVADDLAPRADRAVLGAFERGCLVGVVGMQREAFRKLAHKAMLWGMFVAPDARRSGVGRQLLASALDHAQRLGVSRVTLCVNANNVAALALYRSLGFEAFGREPGFMLHDGVLHDEVYMTRLLPR